MHAWEPHTFMQIMETQPRPKKDANESKPLHIAYAQKYMYEFYIHNIVYTKPCVLGEDFQYIQTRR